MNNLEARPITFADKGREGQDPVYLLEHYSRLKQLLESQNPPIYLKESKVATETLTKLSQQKKLSIHKNFDLIMDTISSEELQALSMLSDDLFTRLCLKKMGIRCPEDFLSTMTEEDLVEGYNTDGIQIFRNLRFMDVCGYSLLDVLSHEWPTLYERSQIITRQLFSAVDKTLQDLSVQLTKLDNLVATHFMKERFSSTRQVCQVSFKHISPLYCNASGEALGFIISSQAKMIDSKPEEDSLRFI